MTAIEVRVVRSQKSRSGSQGQQSGAKTASQSLEVQLRLSVLQPTSNPLAPAPIGEPAKPDSGSGPGGSRDLVVQLNEDDDLVLECNVSSAGISDLQVYTTYLFIHLSVPNVHPNVLEAICYRDCFSPLNLAAPSLCTKRRDLFSCRHHLREPHTLIYRYRLFVCVCVCTGTVYFVHAFDRCVHCSLSRGRT